MATVPKVAASYALMAWITCTIAGAGAASAQTERVVRSTGNGVWGDEVELVEELRIGLLEGPDEYLFGRVVGIAVGPGGEVYVADDMGPVVRMYDSAGRYVRDLGRKGAGPGEYNGIGGVRMMPDGRVAVWDVLNGRVVLFTSDGEPSATIPMGGARVAVEFQADRQGLLYAYTLIGTRGQGRCLGRGWTRARADGAIVDTIHLPPISDCSKHQLSVSSPSGWEPGFVSTYDGTINPLGFLVSGHTDTYAFELRRPGGATLRVERGHRPVRLSRAERREWEGIAQHASRFIRSGEVPEIPREKPAFKDIQTDADGRIWVRPYVPAVRNPEPPGRVTGYARRTWREPVVFDVFEPTGRYLGRLTLPWDSRMLEATGDRLWLRIKGEMDESYLVRYRLEVPGR